MSANDQPWTDMPLTLQFYDGVLVALSPINFLLKSLLLPT